MTESFIASEPKLQTQNNEITTPSVPQGGLTGVSVAGKLRMRLELVSMQGIHLSGQL